MKQTLAAFALAILITINAFGQKEVLFKGVFLPERTYVMKTSTTGAMDVDFKGDDQIVSQLKAGGMTLPIKVTTNQKMNITTKTGAKTNNEIPLVIVYDEMTTTQVVAGKENTKPNPFENLKVDARIKADGKLVVDSIHGNAPPELKQTMILTMESLQNQVKFPTKPMKPGDQFDQEVPLSIPLAGNQPIRLLVKTKYKLKSIKDGKANFDLDQELVLDFNIEQTNATASGKGTGQMTYDIKDSYMIAYSSDLDMSFGMTKDKLVIEAKGKTKTEQVITIE